VDTLYLRPSDTSREDDQIALPSGAGVAEVVGSSMVFTDFALPCRAGAAGCGADSKCIETSETTGGIGSGKGLRNPGKGVGNKHDSQNTKNIVDTSIYNSHFDSIWEQTDTDVHHTILGDGEQKVDNTKVDEVDIVRSVLRRDGTHAADFLCDHMDTGLPALKLEGTLVSNEAIHLALQERWAQHDNEFDKSKVEEMETIWEEEEIWEIQVEALLDILQTDRHHAVSQLQQCVIQNSGLTINNVPCSAQAIQFALDQYLAGFG